MAFPGAKENRPILVWRLAPVYEDFDASPAAPYALYNPVGNVRVRLRTPEHHAVTRALFGQQSRSKGVPPDGAH